MGTIRVERGGHRTYFVDGGMNRVGTPHNIEIKIELGGRVGSGRVGSGLVGSGRFLQEIIPLRGSILQAGTCQILSSAENPRWSPSLAMNSFDSIIK